MDYLDYKQLNRIKSRDFRTRKPFPWANPQGVLKEDAFHHLIERLPDISMFENRHGHSRDHGQKGHNRYSLEYNESLNVAPRWHEFVKELHQHRYRQFLRRLYGFRPMKLTFH
ncbi:MAG: hypothetical protein U9P00_13175 [Pseudomonadota bacterium]|nr:hypothetical protein [Pseudomonadota bacterium]